MTAPKLAEEWTQLASLPDEERREGVAKHFQDLATLAEAERKAQVLAIAKAELQLPDEQVREMVLARLRAWLEMDQEQAQALGAAFEAASVDLPGDMAMRRVTVVQKVAQENLSLEEQDHLRAVVPSVLGERSAAANVSSMMLTKKEAEQAGEAKKQPWWAFWRK